MAYSLLGCLASCLGNEDDLPTMPKAKYGLVSCDISKESHGTVDCLTNTDKLLDLRALKVSPLCKIHIFQCMGKIFCVVSHICISKLIIIGSDSDLLPIRHQAFI